MRFCPVCEQPIADHVSRCARCQALLARHCYRCGAAIDAADNFCRRCGARAGGPQRVAERTVSPLQPPGPGAGPASWGENKYLSVLFADIKDSTRHIEHLDAERTAQFLDEICRLMSEEVHAYGGTVSHVEGDGIMALFGAPQAYEDHAVRACLAALQMQQAVGERLPELAIRVGVNSGAVVLRCMNNDFSFEYRVSGIAVYLARRMEQLARAGSVFITEATYRLIGAQAAARYVASRPLAGPSSAVAYYELIDIVKHAPRWQTRASLGITRYCGREQELARGAELIARFKRGRRVVVAVTGEPGVGKSRFAHELLTRQQAPTWLVLETGAQPYRQNTAYFAIGELLRSWAGATDSDARRRAADKIAHKARLLSPQTAVDRAALQVLLDMPIDDERWRDLAPAERKDRVCAFFLSLVSHIASTRALVLFIEDLQWIDPATQQVLDRLLAAPCGAPRLLVMTARPEYGPRLAAWRKTGRVDEVALTRLDGAAVDELLAAVLGDDAARDPLRARISERGAGIPLFLEELARSVKESGLLQSAEPDRPRRLDAAQELPQTIHSVIATRLDRLPPPDKEAIQVASVLGRRVDVAILIRLLATSEAALLARVRALQPAGPVFLRNPAPAATLEFRHALIQEVAYGSLLAQRRAQLHADTVAAMESEYKDRIAEFVDSLAQHATLAGAWEKALHYHGLAAESAERRSENRRCAYHLERALDALRRLPQSPQILAKRLDLELDLRRLYGVLGDAEKSLAGLAELESVARELDDDVRRAALKTFQSIEYSHLGHISTAFDAAQQAAACALRTHEVGLIANANAALGLAAYHYGAFTDGAKSLADTVALIGDRLRHRRFGATTTMSIRCYGLLAGCLSQTGALADATAAAERALAIADETERPLDRELAWYFLGLCELQRGSVGAAERWLERGLASAKAAGGTYMRPWFESALGYVYSLLPDRAARRRQALALLQRSVRRNRAMKLLYGQMQATVRAAQACVNLGDAERAGYWLRRCAGRPITYQYRALNVWLARTEVELRLAGGAADAGLERHLHTAVALAERLHMAPDVAHCQFVLARLYARRGRDAESRRARDRALRAFRSLGIDTAPFYGVTSADGRTLSPPSTPPG